MVQLSNSLLFALAGVAAHAAAIPLRKRIAQTIADSTTNWEAACDSAGGGAQCNTIAVNAFETLLIAANVCAQQDAADTMITLGKSLNSDDMISLAQLFAQQPRNSPDALAVPYCQSAPNNTELEGFYQCQWQGSNQESFVGGLTLGEAGTIPFGLTAAVSPLGSCPAQTSGPVADGDQLTSTTTNPGTAATGDSTGNNTSSDTSASASVVASTSAVSTLVAASTAAAATTSAVTVDSITATATATAASSSSSSSSNFLLANGEDAQQQNAEFATLTANSSCTEGEDACVNGEFAQCISGAYVLQSCGSGLSCYALPLVNSVGTSITCTTESDAETRITATGATGGVTGSNFSSASSSVAVASSSATSSAAATSASVSAVSAASSSNFLLANGQQAQQQNAEFASLTESSSCTDGDEACVNGEFAQCVDGAYVLQSCGSSLTCLALPLVNKSGTSVTCTTESDAATRIAATGATGGVTGSC
ncbi:uncharacterized protein LAESUDRAFT_765126 [Laetiporus sulphureus 93-53]|uniref:Carbohydrate-binding module family 19 domain-containing protein n=1 Tax=Laetiporus sulphureus 93-53 TaxID=1314785 RepID=A0A165AY83_9APHY|nr:uncharacterized protein LAESUDRAFT_765126 [Laetiporus sulphureus 93-53]KZS99882.1 hypothetical protein LAESUDRAFT_765126 [Laetiporus sulphureus 93-53]